MTQTFSEKIESLRLKLEGEIDPVAHLPILDELSFYLCRINPSEARTYAEEELWLASSLEDVHWMLRGNLSLSNVAKAQGEYKLSENYLRKGWELLKTLPENPIEKASIVRNIGMIACYVGDMRKAKWMLALSLRYAKESKEQREVSFSLTGFCEYYFRLGDFDSALDALEKAFYYFEAESNVSGVIHALSLLGRMSTVLEDWDHAHETLTRGLGIARQHGDKYGEAMFYTYLGNYAQEHEDFDDAANHYLAAMTLFKRIRNKAWQAEVNLQNGRLKARLKEFEAAEECFSLARELFTVIDSRVGPSLVLLEKGEMAVAREDWTRAIELLTEGMEVYASQGFQYHVHRAHRLLAVAYEGNRDLRTSLHHYKAFTELERRLITNEIQRKITAFQFHDKIEEVEHQRKEYKTKAEELERVVRQRSEELEVLSKRIAEHNEFLEQLRERLLDLKEPDQENRALINSIVKHIDLSLQSGDMWESFEHQLQILDQDFVHNLTVTYPELSPAELRVCSLLKLRLSNKEIAGLLNLSGRTIDTHRTKIRKKLGLVKSQDLTEFLVDFGQQG